MIDAFPYFRYKHTSIPLAFFLLLTIPIFYPDKLNRLRKPIQLLLPIGYTALFLVTEHKGLLYWGAANTLCFWILRGYDVSYSLNLSLMGAVAFSWLYELPWFHPLSMFIDPWCTYLVNSGFFGFLAYVYLLILGGYRLDKKQIYALSFFIAWEAVFTWLYLAGYSQPIKAVVGFGLRSYLMRIG